MCRLATKFFCPVTIFSFNMVVSPVWTFLLCLCIWGMSHILLLLICVLYVLGYYFLRFGCSCGYASEFFLRRNDFFVVDCFIFGDDVNQTCLHGSINSNRFWRIRIIELWCTQIKYIEYMYIICYIQTAINFWKLNSI